MKKTDIARMVFEAMDDLPLSNLGGGGMVLPVADLAGLALVPWFCDVSVQWALRLTMPGSPLKKSPLEKAPGTFVSVTGTGAILVGVPGDGIEPSTYALVPLADALGAAVQPGMVVELATANLGIVKRDRDVRAESGTKHGNQRYLGTIDEQRRWVITRTTPALTVDALTNALGCGRMVARNGPWEAKDKAEAYAVVMRWLTSPEANVNPMAVKRFISLHDRAFTNTDPGMVRKLCGLGLGFFRHRLGGGPFRWQESGPSIHPLPQLEEVARAVVG